MGLGSWQQPTTQAQEESTCHPNFWFYLEVLKNLWKLYPQDYSTWASANRALVPSVIQASSRGQVLKYVSNVVHREVNEEGMESGSHLGYVNTFSPLGSLNRKLNHSVSINASH